MTYLAQPRRQVEWDDPVYDLVALKLVGLFHIIAPHIDRTPWADDHEPRWKPATSTKYLSGMCATGRHRRCTGTLTNGHRCTCATCRH